MILILNIYVYLKIFLFYSNNMKISLRFNIDEFVIGVYNMSMYAFKYVHTFCIEFTKYNNTNLIIGTHDKIFRIFKYFIL